MDGYQRRTEKKKENIRQAALELFSIYGVEKVSISEIAKKANVSPVSIYNYFGSKEELSKSVIEEFMKSQFEDFEKLLLTETPFPQKVEKILFDKNEVATKMGTEFLKSITDPSLQGFIEEFTNIKAIPMLLELIEQGRKEGYVNPHISSEAIMLYIHIFNEATASPEILLNSSKEALLELGHLFFYGLLGKPSKE
jgi:AcrR family transcriptional regulator